MTSTSHIDDHDDFEVAVARGGAEILTNTVALLDDLATRTEQTWPELTEKWGVSNPLPPWKSSLDGLCDALDEASCSRPGAVPNFEERRREEDALVQVRYSALPYPENQLVALVHSLVGRGVIDEAALRARIDVVRARLEMATG